jgi:hypothetical protein
MNARITTAGRVNPGRLFAFIEKGWLTLVIVVSCFFLLGSESLSGLAAWQRTSPIGIQAWSAHFSHWSGGHLFWDLLMFGALALTLEATSRRLLVRLLLIAPPLITATVFLMENHAFYRGLSGLDCTLYAALAVVAVKNKWIGPATAILASGLFAGKCVFEIMSGQTLFVSDLPQGITGVPWAHLSGAAVGAIIAWIHTRQFPTPAVNPS